MLYCTMGTESEHGQQFLCSALFWHEITILDGIEGKYFPPLLGIVFHFKTKLLNLTEGKLGLLMYWLWIMLLFKIKRWRNGSVKHIF